MGHFRGITNTLIRRIFNGLRARQFNETTQHANLNTRRRTTTQVASRAARPSLLTFRRNMTNSQCLTTTVRIFIRNTFNSSSNNDIIIVRQHRRNISSHINTTTFSTRHTLTANQRTIISTSHQNSTIFRARASRANNNRGSHIMLTNVRLNRTDVSITTRRTSFRI